MDAMRPVPPIFSTWIDDMIRDALRYFTYNPPSQLEGLSISFRSHCPERETFYVTNADTFMRKVRSYAAGRPILSRIALVIVG